jgi:cytochrome c oxidase subunit 4
MHEVARKGTAGAHGETLGHVVPVRVLVTVLAVLLALTIVTVAVTWVDLGPLNLVIALVIATIKGALVLLYFMHLRWDRPFHAVVLISALAFVMLFVGLSLLDSVQYQPDVIPGYAPAVEP